MFVVAPARIVAVPLVFDLMAIQYVTPGRHVYVDGSRYDFVPVADVLKTSVADAICTTGVDDGHPLDLRVVRLLLVRRERIKRVALAGIAGT